MDKLIGLIEPILLQNDVILYELKWRQENKNKILSLAIMHQDGSMDIDTCVFISEKVSELLDETDPISHEYYLEVCSPGAERILRDLSETKAAVGNYVKVKLNQPLQDNTVLLGDLKEVKENIIVLETIIKKKTEVVEINYENIKQIRLAIKF